MPFFADRSSRRAVRLGSALAAASALALGGAAAQAADADAVPPRSHEKMPAAVLADSEVHAVAQVESVYVDTQHGSCQWEEGIPCYVVPRRLSIDPSFDERRTYGKGERTSGKDEDGSCRGAFK